MSDLDRIVEEQKLRLKKIRDRVQQLTEEIHVRKSGISADLFSATKDKLSEFSPTVFSEIQNMLLEEIAKGYDAIVKEKEKVIQQLQKDIEEVSLKYANLDTILKEQIARVSILSAEKDKTEIDLLKKTVQVTNEQNSVKSNLEKNVIEKKEDLSVKTNFDFLYSIANEILRFIRTRRGVIEEALKIIKDEIGASTTNNKVIFVSDEINKISEIMLKLKESLYIPEVYIQSINLNTLIDDVLTKMHSNIENKNVSIIKHLSQEEIFIYADKNLIENVLSEILQNSIESFVRDNNNKIIIKILKEKEVVKLKITDNGCGIPEHLLPKIFNLFFTTKVETKHFGIGLFRTYWILKMFNASILVNSIFDQGTDVEISFNTKKI